MEPNKANLPSPPGQPDLQEVEKGAARIRAHRQKQAPTSTPPEPGGVINLRDLENLPPEQRQPILNDLFGKRIDLNRSMEFLPGTTLERIRQYLREQWQACGRKEL